MQVRSPGLFFPLLIVVMVLIFANHVPNTHILINVLKGAQEQGTGLGIQVATLHSSVLQCFHCFQRHRHSLCPHITHCRSQNVAYRVFGSIPGPIMFGSLIDSTCVKWEGHCTKYDLDSLRRTFVMTSFVCAVVSTFFFGLMWYLYEVRPNLVLSQTPEHRSKHLCRLRRTLTSHTSSWMKYRNIRGSLSLRSNRALPASNPINGTSS